MANKYAMQIAPNSHLQHAINKGEESTRGNPSPGRAVVPYFGSLFCPLFLILEYYHPPIPPHTTSLARGWQDGRGLTAQLQPDAVPDHASCLWKTTKPGQARSDLSVQHP